MYDLVHESICGFTHCFIFCFLIFLIFKVNIFSFINQCYYFEFHFYPKSLKPLLKVPALKGGRCMLFFLKYSLRQCNSHMYMYSNEHRAKSQNIILFKQTQHELSKLNYTGLINLFPKLNNRAFFLPMIDYKYHCPASNRFYWNIM